MKRHTALLAVLCLAVLVLAGCGDANGPAGVHAGDEIQWEEPATGGSDPVIRKATVTGWEGTWIECSDGKRIDASTFDSLQVSCPHS